MKRVIFLLTIGVILSIAMIVFAVDEGSMYVSVDATLLDASGEPFTPGVYCMKFNIYKNLTDVTVLWSTGDVEEVPVEAGGRLEYDLGWVSASVFLPDSPSDDGVRYVQIFTCDDNKLSERIKITDVYSFPVATGVKAATSTVQHTKIDTPSETIQVPLLMIPSSAPTNNGQYFEQQIKKLTKRVERLEKLAKQLQNHLDSIG